MTRIVLIAVLSFLGTSFLPVASMAQPAKKKFVPKAQPKVNKTKRKKAAEQKGPRLGTKDLDRRRNKSRNQIDVKDKEIIRKLKALIRETPNDSPEKAIFLDRLAEIYWQRAGTIDMRAFDKEEACLKSISTPEEMDACKATREKRTALSQKFRDGAIKLYVQIVRNHPDYEALDQVLFALGFNYQRKEEPEKAKKIYKKLVQMFPRSDKVPETLFYFAELVFDEGKVDMAKKLYLRLVGNHKKSSIYGYAKYKLAWCYFNLQEFKAAMKSFIDVLQYSRKMKGGKQRLTLETESIRDMVRTFVHIKGASPKSAIRFFKKYVRKDQPNRHLALAEKVAQLYSDTGQVLQGNELYRALIKERPKSYEVVGYQRAITDNTRSLDKPGKTVKALKRLVALFKKRRNAGDAKPKRVEKDYKGIEELVRSLAVTYHRQALKTENDQDYKVAELLYDDYVDLFVDTVETYNMNFYFAELLYKRKRWKEAARRYEHVIELKPGGEYIKEATHSTVLAYKKLLKIAKLKKKRKVDDEGSGEIPKARELSEDHRRFIKACDQYATYVEESEHLTDIEYEAALVFYDHDQLKEAIPRFRKIAENQPQHRLAKFAADFLLDCYILLKDFSGLNQRVDTLLGIYNEDTAEKLHGRLVLLKQKATFNECRGLETGSGEKAAQCFEKYAVDFSESEDLDKALWNAAFNYEKERLYSESNEALKKLVESGSDSELVPKALFLLGKNFQNQAIYSKASEFFEMYAKAFADNDMESACIILKEELSARVCAQKALQNAAFFRMGLGNLDKAINNYKAYMKLVGRKDQAKASEVFFSIGDIHQKRKAWGKVINHYNTFLKRYKRVAKDDLIIEAYARMGAAYWEQARPHMESKRKKWKKFDRFNKPAQKAYGKAYKYFQSLSKAKKKALTSGIAAVAESRFRMGENLFLQFRYRTRLRAKSYRNLKKFIATMVEKIKGRTVMVVAAQDLYQEVITLASPKWAIAALARIGEMYQQLSNDIYNYPAPKSFDEETAEFFRGDMADRSDLQRAKAIDAYTLCLTKAREFRWFNYWSNLAERQLAELDPSNFRYNAEILADPSHLALGQLGVTFYGKPVKEASQ